MAPAPRLRTAKPVEKDSNDSDALKPRKRNLPPEDSQVHILKPGIKCDTEARGHATPRSRGRLDIVVDSSDGFIPLWAKGTVLRWRFRERSLTYFDNPKAAKTVIRKLLGEAILAWDMAAPVKFKEDDDLWDFEIVMKATDDCDATGCTLASAFFPDAGRHKLLIYPQMFEQNRKEQIETLIHEIGHVFGLRHFFANIEEKEWPSTLFGSNSKFTIMNYGNLSRLTPADKNDLTKLYKAVWSGALTEVNGTKIKQVKCFSGR